MNLAIQEFEKLVGTEKIVEHAINYLEAGIVTLVFVALCYIVNKVFFRKYKCYKIINELIDITVILGKALFSYFALIYTFFYDYQNHSFSFHHIFEITQLSAGSFLVGVLAIAEILSVIKLVLDKIAGWDELWDIPIEKD